MQNVTLRAGKLAETGKGLKCGQLAKLVGLTRQHVYRLAKAGNIPGAKLTKGGQFYFVRCPALEGWIRDRSLNHSSRQRWPAHMEVISKFSRAAKFAEGIELPRETLNRLGELIRPIAARIWPPKSISSASKKTTSRRRPR